MTAAAEHPSTLDRPYGRVARNTVVYFLGQVLTWGITFVSLSIVPRALGERGMGELAVAGAAVGTVASIMGLSVEAYLTKEIGRDRDQAERLLRATLGLRILMIVPTALIAMVVLRSMSRSLIVWQLGMLSIADTAMVFWSNPARSVQAGWEHAKRVSALDFVGATTPLVAIPFLRFGPRGLAFTAVLVSFGITVTRTVWVRRYVRMAPLFDWRLWKEIIKGGLPFLANNNIISLYGFVSIFILKHFTDDSAVGVYSQAMRLFGTFLFVPTALGAALLPSLARLASADEAEFRRLQSRVLSLLVILGLPVTVSVIVLAAPFCHLLYGMHKFVAMPQVLHYYALAIIPVYIVSTMYQFLVAQGRNAVWTLFLGMSVVIYAVCCGVLVPLTIRSMHNGVVGAVMSTFIAESCSALFAFLLLRTNPFSGDAAGRTIRGIAAAAGMGAVMWALCRMTGEAPSGDTTPRYLRMALHLLVPAGAGAAAYTLLAWQLRVLTPDEKVRVIGALRRKLRPAAAAHEAA